MTQFNNSDELHAGFEEAGTHSWPIQDAHGDHYLVTCTEDGDVFAQGLPYADEDGSNYNRNLISDLDFRAEQYPFTALAAERDAPRLLDVGGVETVGLASMLAHSYAVHSGLLQPEGEKVPVLLVDLEGLSDDLPQRIRLIIPEPLGRAIVDAAGISLEQLRLIK